MKVREAIVFIDGSNFYHNSKLLIDKTKRISFQKLAELICFRFDLQLKQIRYYNAVPDISDDKKPIIDIWSF
jgi:hypothetical protein